MTTEECAQRDAGHGPAQRTTGRSQNWLLRGGTLQDDGSAATWGRQAAVAGTSEGALDEINARVLRPLGPKFERRPASHNARRMPRMARSEAPTYGLVAWRDTTASKQQCLNG